MNQSPPPLTPRLVVSGADAAIAFYTRVFDAKLIERFADGDGHVVHRRTRLGPGGHRAD